MAQSKWGDKDWWLGRTPEWQSRQAAVQGAGQSVSNAGGRMIVWGLVVTLATLFVIATAGLGLIVVIPLFIWWRRRRNTPKPVPHDPAA